MFPALLDLSALRIALAGSGPACVRRLRLLDAAGAPHLRVFTPHPDAAVCAAAGGRLVPRLPEEADLTGLHVLFVAALPEEDANRLAATARELGVLVNTEDIRPLSDFHVPAMVRRGGLLFTVSTGGGSPGLARRLRGELERRFGPEWAERLEELAAARDRWRREGVPLKELARRTDELIDGKDWLT